MGSVAVRRCVACWPSDTNAASSLIGWNRNSPTDAFGGSADRVFGGAGSEEPPNSRRPSHVMITLSSHRYVIDLPAHHTFPIQKYHLVREQLLAEGTLTPGEVLEPRLVDSGDIRLVHTAAYWENLAA